MARARTGTAKWAAQRGRRPQSSIARNAYHEAGHVVAALHLGLYVQRVSIVPDADVAPGNLGVTQYFQSVRMLEILREDVPAAEVERAVLTLYAGFAAETRFRAGARTRWRDRSSSDFMLAKRILVEHCDIDWAELDAKSRQAQLAARRLVTSRKVWVAVSCVARALLRRGTLGAKDLRELMPLGIEDVAAVDASVLRRFRGVSCAWFRNGELRRANDELDEIVASERGKGER